ncbi:MAG: hypothetical protein HY896_02575 [Deltaproteobacteria bacterium]|nr:hypothetical protein [Deltaproteobacteria bacterium]
MQTFTVYRVDYASGMKVPVGAIQERRTKERGANFFGLLFLARKKYAESPLDAFRITLGKSRIESPHVGGLRRSPG